MKLNRTLEELMRDGLNAHDRLQEAIKDIEDLLKTIQVVPEIDALGDDVAQERVKEIEGRLVEMIFDAGWMRESLTGVDENARGQTIAYRNAYDAVPNAYRDGRRDAIRDLNAGLSDHAQRVVRLIANGLAKLDEDECYQVCEQLCASLPGKKHG
jgi:uncharacterized protein YnzC (UPF0291/DUF896 family)